jgi:folate-binding protein YgfZ
MSDAAFLAEYERVVTTGGVVSLSGWSTLVITGADRVTFLQNMCTNDVRALKAGESCEAFLTDVKGKIVGHVVVFAQAGALVLVGVPGQAARWIAHLDRYIIREDVQLVDASARWEWGLVIGSGADGEVALAGNLIAVCPQLWVGAVWAGQVMEHAEGESAKPPAAAERRRATGVSDAVWQALRIESGWPLFGVDFDGSHLPQEVSRNARAISFRKGCYLGQETVARIDALGRVNKQLATVEAAEELRVADELSAGEQVVGHVTSATYSPRRKVWLALAMLRRGHNDPGAAVACRGRAAAVVPTPP